MFKSIHFFLPQHYLLSGPVQNSSKNINRKYIMPSFPAKVSMGCSLDQLRKEAASRGLELGNLPWNKSALVEILGEGSISCKAAKLTAKRDVSLDTMMSGMSLSALPSTVNKHCTVEQMREEAEYRGYDLGNVPLTKAMLLDMLGNGSTCLKAVKKAASAGKKTPPKKPKMKKNVANKHSKAPMPSGASKIHHDWEYKYNYPTFGGRM